MGIVVVQPLYDNFNEIREFVRAAVVVELRAEHLPNPPTGNCL